MIDPSDIVTPHNPDELQFLQRENIFDVGLVFYQMLMGIQASNPQELVINQSVLEHEYLVTKQLSVCPLTFILLG